MKKTKRRAFARTSVYAAVLAAVLLCTFILTAALNSVTTAYALSQPAGLELSSQSAVLMEASTGQIIYEKNGSATTAPASITKIMTLLLIFDAIESGKISLDTQVSVSAHAASMGGSQVYLEAGEIQTVDTMIKCIAVASANDACVSMAELIGGTEEAFVEKMNERAKGLGMENTHFVNSCGLDADGHVSSAMDVALMSRELITKYPQIHDYSTIWMDTIIHSTKRGDSEFGLTNTNKLIKQYEWATGLKTGSTSKAGCCLSATASKDGIDLIAVVMTAPDSKTRFAEAETLLNYGFANCYIYKDEEDMNFSLRVSGGTESLANGVPEKLFSYMFMSTPDTDSITKRYELNENVAAPVCVGDVLGEVVYEYEGRELGRVRIVADKDVTKAKYRDAFGKCILKFLKS